MLLRIGTRGSKLALAQSRWVRGEILARHPDVQVELVRIKTTGDKILDTPLSRIGGKGLFVKEIEEALLRRDVDLAVHSIKDIPARLPDGLMLSAFPEREDPRDALVSEGDLPLDALPAGARVGTSSLRRGAQLLRRRPDLVLVPLRGNVDTRLAKLDSGNLEAIVLAAAGLKRLGLEGRISQAIPVEYLLPAIGQGALGLEVRRHDGDTLRVLDFMDHEPTRITVLAERAFLAELDGGCQVPIAGFARMAGDRVVIEGMVSEPDGNHWVSDTLSGPVDRAADMGRELARKLLAAGADKILQNLYAQD
ncbi:MAG: hydroxymethylbilane synthase [Deltaproteobacteria bacterium]|nr:hydroxymethylbilane synthase [Deltaproteobacteria bacterium]MBW1815656.1 hydroxymethylbilane synthase [Deltaproteobacteria bacterium]